MEAPDFSLKDHSGEKKNFQSVKGQKLTIVVFWSTWSAKSEKALLRLEKLYQQCKDKGLGVVAVNVDGQEINAEAFNGIKAKVEKLKLSYPTLIDYGLQAFHDYGVIAVPSIVILDGERVIKYELSGFPLVGAEDMADYVSSNFEGKKTEAAPQKKGYAPDKKAIRHYNMGLRTLKSRRMADTAEMWFVKAIEADPGFIMPYLSLGKFYTARENIAQAKEQFQKALAIEPANPAALCELGLIFIKEGKSAEGRQMLDSALRSDDSYLPCYYYSGMAFGKEGKLDEALKAFQSAVDINPHDPYIYIYKGEACEENKQLQAASEAYQKALELILN
jgi:Tfp pilus assembly protein PilF/peroxiredoxin